MSDLLERLKDALASRYLIEREIGHGGMATVYLAADIRHARHVAVKVFRPEVAVILGAERFLHEVRVTAKLQHPHILPLFDSGEADGFLFYVMPYVRGESLRNKLNREKQLPVEEAIGIVGDVAAGLQHAHGHGVIHRDIKPENILLAEGQALVMDFGIALALSAAGGERITETGMALGTPHYISPEQLTADRVPDARTDIYSLGCVLYEMLTGDPPHAGSTVQAVISKVIAETPPRLRALRETVPEHVETAVHKALAKLPADRFSSASLFVEALTHPTISSGPVAVGTFGGAGRVRALGARFRTVANWRAAVLWGVPAVVLGALLRWVRPHSPPNERVTRFSITQSFSERITYADDIAMSPDGRTIVYAGGGLDRRRLYARALNVLEAVPIPGTLGGGEPFFSPDGEGVGFLVSDTLRTVALSGGPPRTVLAGVALSGRGATWGPNNVIVFNKVDHPGLWKISPPAEPRRWWRLPGETRNRHPPGYPTGGRRP